MSVAEYKKLSSCDLCGGSSQNFDVLVSEVLHKGSVLYELGITSSYETVMCKSCGWIFKPGVLTDQQLEELYGEYGGEATFNDSCENVSRVRSNQLYNWVTKYAAINKGCSVLDVGGGVGQATSVFADKGYSVTVLDMAGGELINENMKLVKSTIYQFMPTQNYDLIFMNHVLEHVWDPTRLFSHAYELLSDTGFLYVEVPFELITPLIKAKLGDPCHVGYFSLRTLNGFFAKCGYEVIKLERALGWYNARRVMILRGLVKKKQGSSTEGSNTVDDYHSVLKNVSRLTMKGEIFNATQMYIILKLILSKILSKVLRRN